MRRIVLCAALVLATSAAHAAERRVINRDRDTDDLIRSSGAVVLEDYGAFVLAEFPDTSLRSADAAPLPGRRVTGSLRLRDGGDARVPGKGTLTPELEIADYAGDTRGLYIVQFYGPIRAAWVAALESAGGTVVEYLPENAFVVRMTPEVRQSLAGLLPRGLSGRSPLEWTGVYQPAYRLASALVGRQGRVAVSMLVLDTEEGRTLAERLLAGGEAIEPVSAQRPYLAFKVALDAGQLEALAFDPSVYRIDEWHAPVLLDEPGAMNMAGLRVNGDVAGFGLAGVPWLTWLGAHGIDRTSASTLIDIADTGIDKGNRSGNWQRDLYGPDGITPRVTYVKDWTNDAGAYNDGVDGVAHGTNCAGVAAGYDNAGGSGTGLVSRTGYHFGLGVAPFARLGGSKLFRIDGTWGLTRTLTEVMANAWAQGARISSNSWGSGDDGYPAQAREYDALVRDSVPGTPGNQPMIVLFAAGNSGPLGGIHAPGTAKNVITVGAAENWWPSNTTCGWSSALQNTPGDDIAPYSSRGPCADGRIKPDVVAIGHGWVTSRSGAAGAGCGAPFDTADPSLYVSFNGTSAATAAAAGAAALAYETLTRRMGTPPSPALVKAALIATARDLAGGVNANADDGTGPVLEHTPSRAQGWGLVDLGRLFDPTITLVDDQTHRFTASGQSARFGLKPVDPAKPMRIVMTWTDAPGNVGAYTQLQNTLTLRATTPERRYLGDTFGGDGFSDGTASAAATVSDNVQVVAIPPAREFALTVSITADNITSDGVPGNADGMDQDYALYAYNAATCTLPAQPSAITVEASGPNQVTVRWPLPALPVLAHAVYRDIDNTGKYELIGTVPWPATSFVDTNVSGGSDYSYIVTARTDCESDPTLAVHVTATGACRRSPTFSTWADASGNQRDMCQVTVHWSQAQSNCSRSSSLTYNVYRSTQRDFEPAPENRLVTGISAVSFVDALGTVDRRHYWYAIRVVDPLRGFEEGPVARADGWPTGVYVSSVYRNASPYLALTDGDPVGVTSTMDVTDSGMIGTAHLTVGISDAYRSDLVVRLTSPHGTTVTVHDRTGGKVQGLSASYDDETMSDGPGDLGDFVGEDTKGTWRLQVADVVGGNNGTLLPHLSSWGISLTNAGQCTPGFSALPSEASPAGELRALRGAGDTVTLSYAPAAAATDHAVYYGPHRTYFYACLRNVGASGTASVNIPRPGTGLATYFVIVGNNGLYEGSYGRDSGGHERAPYTGCGYTRALP